MKLLFLCGYFAEENEKEIIEHAKAPVEYSANVFQKKIIKGFKAVGTDVQVLSAPFIGAYPNKSDIFWFKGFERTQTECQYVPFCNIWGLRNYSRAFSLKQCLHDFVAAEDEDKLIIVYSPHTPFVEAAAYAKRRDPRIKVILVVPDLPQYMNLSAKISTIYKVAKKYDIARFNRLCECVDGYVLLTEAMKEKLPVGRKKYIVIEGISDPELLNRASDRKSENQGKEKYLVYTGKLNEKFGVKELVDSFGMIDDPDCRLVLCGRGDLESYIQNKALEDSRILPQGQVTHDEAKAWITNADVLVNPRMNNEEYVKYSFPSKNIEYLSSGNPVVGYLLDGMPAHYREYLFCVDDGDLSAAMVDALYASDERKQKKFEACMAHLLRRTPEAIAREIVNFSKQI